MVHPLLTQMFTRLGKDKTGSGKSPAFYISLRKKSLLFIALLCLYGFFVAQHLLNERVVLLGQFDDFQKIQKSESILSNAHMALNNTYIHLLLESRKNKIITKNSLLHQDFLNLEKQYSALLDAFPAQAEYYRQIVKLLASLVNTYSAENEQVLLQILHSNQQRMEALLTQNTQKRQTLFDLYYERSHTAAQSALIMGAIGVLVFGVVIVVFFAHMTNDIRLLQSRVRKIIQGEWGEPVFIKRNDELGQLNKGINEMSQRLAISEKALEMERRNFFDQEKNCALAHLAAGLVHEIGNPVSAISSMTEMIKESASPDSAEMKEYLDQVEHYSKRLIAITEDLTRLGTPPDNQFGLIDLNSLINDVCGLVHYDERWFGIDVTLDLAAGLPAVNGVTEQLRQVLLNVLSNAYDALQTEEIKVKKIELVTSFDEVQHKLIIIIKDNGEGMSEEVLDKAFDPLFTTKANEHGAGLGLSLCRSLIAHHGGDIDIDSVIGKGTQILISLPAYQE